MTPFQGVIPILATPFLDDETLDLESWHRLLEFMIEIGVDGVTILGVLGESNRLVDDEREKRVADGLTIPIVLQDHPASSEVHFSVPLILRLVREVPAIRCLKQEAVPTAPKIRQLREGMGESGLPILTGLGALYAPFDLEAGSDGFNTGFAFPEVLMEMVRAARVGAWADLEKTPATKLR